MSGDFESNVVEAVEKRWARQNAAERKARRNRMLGSLMKFLVWLVLLGVVLLAFLYSKSDIANRFDVANRLRNWLSFIGTTKDEPVAEEVKLNAGQLERYCHALESFTFQGKSARWRDAPGEIKPATAVSGKVYYSLVENPSRGYDIYEITTLGGGRVAVRQLSPYGNPAKIKTSEFTSLCSGKKYFISHDGVVYACGKASVEDAKTISRRILDRTTPAGHVLGP